MKRQNQGITLVALVVTIVVLLILAGVSISTVLGENGLITQARKAAKETNAAQEAEIQGIDNLEISFAESTGTFVDSVNKPNLKAGMTPINFVVNASGVYEAKKTSLENADNAWYNYADGKWANAQTEDGSMWVWIPRFAYKINNDTKTFDVKFLIGTTDYYYETVDGEQVARKAARGTATASPDTKTTYTVHPAFTNESSIGFANGGWDSELTGIWVAKFEAGYATSNGSTTPNVKSSVKYTNSTVYASSTETPEGQGDNWITARNWLDGEYGGTTNISYPTFQGAAYSMNYVNHREAFALCSVLTESGNVYGLKDDTDSHLMKNSEWGAVAYLAKSQYGLAGDNIYINNVSMNGGAVSGKAATENNPYLGVYAITGVESSVSANGNTSGTSYTIISDIAQVNDKNQRTSSNIKIWSDADGGKSSTTGDVYGVFDMSGGLWEETADYIANNKNTGRGNSYNSYTNATDAKYKRDFTYTSAGAMRTTSSKYATVWPYNTGKNEDNTDVDSGDYDTAGRAHYTFGKNLGNKIYGSAVFETSNLGSGANSWYNDYSIFPAMHASFFSRGGRWIDGTDAGLFAFSRGDGRPDFGNGFRAVLV